MTGAAVVTTSNLRAPVADDRVSYLTRLEQLIQNQANACLSPAGLSIGTPATGVEIANTVTYLVAGEFQSKTTAQVAFTATTHDITANASSVQERLYAITLDAAGTPTMTAGDVATGAGNAQMPTANSLPSGESLIGTVRIAVAAGSTDFDATTDLLSAGHLTDTYTDMAYVPVASIA